MGVVNSSVKLVSTTFDTVATTVTKVGNVADKATSALEAYATRLEESAKDSLEETRQNIAVQALTRHERAKISLAVTRENLHKEALAAGCSQASLDKADADLKAYFANKE